jgi:hypothetical protein
VKDQSIMDPGQASLPGSLKLNRVFQVTQTVYAATGIQSSTTVSVTGEIVFKASDLPQWSSFSALFDQFKIKRVTLLFRPVANQLYTGTAISVPTMATAIDQTGNGTPSTTNQVLEYESALLVSATTPFTRTLVPKALLQMYLGVASTSYTPVSRWIDCATGGGTPHYGVIYSLNASPVATSAYTYQVDVRYEMMFKNVR